MRIHARPATILMVPFLLSFACAAGLTGCAAKSAPLEGTWTAQPAEGEQWWFEFDADRTGVFSGTNKPPTDCIWTRIDDLDQLKAFVARTGASLRAAVRDGTPLPYAPDGQYLVLVDSGAGKGFPLIRIISLDQTSLVVEFEGAGAQPRLAMQRVE